MSKPQNIYKIYWFGHLWAYQPLAHPNFMDDYCEQNLFTDHRRSFAIIPWIG